MSSAHPSNQLWSGGQGGIPQIWVSEPTIVGGEASENGAVGWADIPGRVNSTPFNGVKSGFSVNHTVLGISCLSVSLILIFYIPRRPHPSVDIFSITWAIAIDLAIVSL